MDYTSLSNYSILYEQSVTSTLLGTSSVNEEQIFFNPSVGQSLPKLDYTEISDEDYLNLKNQKLTYDRTGTLFSSDPLSSITPSFTAYDQYDLLDKAITTGSLSEEFIEKYLLGQSDDESTLDVSA